MSPRRALVSVVLLGASVVACVIAEPSAALPGAAARRPIIVSAVPTPTRVLSTWQPFEITVELSDPTARFEWAAFIDYDPVVGGSLVADGENEFSPTNPPGDTRTQTVLLTPPSSDRCHVVQIAVAPSFRGREDERARHTPNDPGGDSVSWFYAPSGDFASCPRLDAGVTDAAPP